jgi:hypothetical protein
MSRLPLILLVLLATTSMVAADPLYKWVDDQGKVHYSDKPQPGAQKIKLPTATTYKAPTPAQGPAPAATDQDTQAQQPPYTDFEISSPGKDEVLWNVTSVQVTLSVKPGDLHPGDQVTITLDGKVQGPLHSLTATFNDMDRGEHTVSANLQEADGSVLVAKEVTFFIQHSTKH